MSRSLATAFALATISCHATPEPVAAAPASSTAPTNEPAEDAADDPEDATDQLPAVAPSTVPTSASAGAALFAEAQRELAAMRASRYEHHTHVDEATGTFDFDCSGFVDYALARVAPAVLRGLQAQTVPRPLAKHFEAVIAGASDPSQPWRRVDHVRELTSGDVIAWLEPPVKHSRNTGHVMIVAAPPTPGARAGEWVIAVIDSSHSGHGKRDARIRDHHNGLGTGDLVLLVDADDHAVGYRWSTWVRSTPYRTEIALGRLR